MAPAAGARRLAGRAPAVHDRSRPGDDHDTRVVARAGHERDERVVDDEDAGFVADAPHDRPHELRFVGAIDAGNAETDRVGNDGPIVGRAIADRLLHHLVEHFLDGELARRMKVRARSARCGDDRAVLVRE